MPFQDTSENGVKRCLIEIGKCNNIEVSLETRCNERFATTWRSHRSYNQCVNDGPERMLIILAIIPTIAINKLSQNLNWWLRTIFLELWHVQIIYIDDTFCAKSWTKCVSSSLIELHVYNVLNHVAMCLRREADLDD